MSELIVQLEGSVDLEVSAQPSVEIGVEMESQPVIVQYGEKYKGEYEVTPSLSEQVLPTKEKIMVDDLTIYGVPVHRTRNASGGTTVYIAKELEYGE